MAKVDSTIKNETKNIALCVLILSALMEAVFLIIGKWNYTVLLGNILGGSAGVLNFFLMGMGLQSAIDKDQQGAKATVTFSHTYRQIILAGIMVASIFVPFLDAIATIASIFFASMGVYIRVFVMKQKSVGMVPTSDNMNNINDMNNVDNDNSEEGVEA